jgi:hypothetical protein
MDDAFRDQQKAWKNELRKSISVSSRVDDDEAVDAPLLGGGGIDKQYYKDETKSQGNRSIAISQKSLAKSNKSNAMKMTSIDKMAPGLNTELVAEHREMIDKDKRELSS